MLQLLIGNKNYSSWSLRSWLLLRVLDIPFEEIRLSFNDPDFRLQVLQYSPAGKVPVLIDHGQAVWDTLAIAEYLAEHFPDAGVWPEDPQARALARCLCAEMHSGFGALRTAMPMNVEASLPGLGMTEAVQRDIDRLVAAWTDCRSRFGDAGPFLCGTFGAVDAFFAPVALRLTSHAVALPAAAQAYVDSLLALPALQQWCEEACREDDFVAADEPYRTPDRRLRTAS
ncbi:glutathione S-transferase family protein [Chitinilyticum litopenaei]|uniref:glutathione S-transferase family protein n=1 Tax=Chitinilyticum litopenaei TaxID=1121276 RepID=UPI000406E6CF|nr:glutathione S-transferase family protein [Chitinilyticum litopenaei]